MNTIYFEALTPESIARAAEHLFAREELLGIPTETVYGLGANALDEEAVLHIFEAKGRPQDNPLTSVHVPDASWLERYCENVPEAAYRLAENFWPGPLTMILPRKPIVPLRTTGGLETVGVRCPDHPVTLADRLGPARRTKRHDGLSRQDHRQRPRPEVLRQPVSCLRHVLAVPLQPRRIRHMDDERIVLRAALASKMCKTASSSSAFAPRP